MRRFSSDLLAKIAIYLLIAAALAWPAEAQIGPPPGGGSTSPGGAPGNIQYNNSGAFGGRAASGSGTTVVTTTGSLTSGDCVKVDANGNMVDSGGACGGSSGVNSITTACPAGLSGATGAVTATGAIPTNAQTGTSYAVAAGDCGKLLTFSNASATSVTLPQAGTTGFLSGYFIAGVQNLGAGAVTITPTTSTINGAPSLTLVQNQAIAGIVSDGTNYFAQVIPVPGGSNGYVQYNNNGVFGGRAASGTGTTIVTTTGSQTTGDCVKIDANGNHVDAGGACAGSPGGANGQIQYNNAGSFGGVGVIGSGSVVEASSLTGTGTKVATSTGTLTSGDCVKIDASGNLVDNGSACAGSGSPGGSSGQIQYNNSGSFGGYPLSGNGTTVASASGSLTSAGGDCAKFDSNGNVADAGAACNSYTTLPGYQSSLWFTFNAFPGITYATGSTGTVGVTYCSPLIATQKFTFDQVAANVQTVGSTTVHLALYANAYDSANHHYYPSGSPLVQDNNGPADTSTGMVTFTFASNYQVSPGVYWACFQPGDTAVKMYSIANTTVNTLYSNIMGTASSSGSAGNLLVVGVKSSTGAFGTWPNSSNWTGNGWTEMTSSNEPVFAVHVASVP